MSATGHLTEDDQSHETQPLIEDGSLRRGNSHTRPSFIPTAHSPRVIIALIFTIIFVLAFGGFIMAVPAIRIYEDIICHHYYENLKGEGHIGLEGDIDEKLCKEDPIQGELNVLLAVMHFLGAIPALLMTVPYGMLADRIGRKYVFVLSMIGMILSGVWNFTVMWFWKVLPLRLVWLCPAFIFIGGGQAVAGMMFYAIGCDVTTESNRANVFLLGKGAAIIAELIAPTVSSFLMSQSPWPPLFVGLGTLVFGTGLILLIPETLHRRPSEESEVPADSLSERSMLQRKKSNVFPTTKAKIADALTRIYEATSVLHSLPILLLLITFITEPVGAQSVDLSIRYISKRFSWELRQTNFLISLRAFVSLSLILLVIPGCSFCLTERLHYSSKAKDLSLARYSATMLVVGALIFASSPTIGLTVTGLVIYTLGGGFAALTRALITTLVDKEHIGRLYAAIAVVEVCTAVTAGPSIAALYAIGMKLKGPWLALPFYALTVVCFIAGIGVWFFGSLTGKQEDDVPYEDEERDTFVGNTVFVNEDTTQAGIINPT